MDHQDWKQVVLTKRPEKNKNVKNKLVAVPNTNNNFKTQGTGKKIKDDDEVKKIPTVGIAIGKQIAQARTAKKMTQKDLANKMNITTQIIQQNECGKALRNNGLLARFERALGAKFER